MLAHHIYHILIILVEKETEETLEALVRSLSLCQEDKNLDSIESCHHFEVVGEYQDF